MEESATPGNEIGLNVFTTSQNRPKSAKKVRPGSNIKSSIKKMGQDYSRLSRAIGLMRAREPETQTPLGVYESYTDMENSVVKDHNKSLHSLQDPPNNHENSFYQHTNSSMQNKYK